MAVLMVGTPSMTSNIPRSDRLYQTAGRASNRPEEPLMKHGVKGGALYKCLLVGESGRLFHLQDIGSFLVLMSIRANIVRLKSGLRSSVMISVSRPSRRKSRRAASRPGKSLGQKRTSRTTRT